MTFKTLQTAVFAGAIALPMSLTYGQGSTTQGQSGSQQQQRSQMQSQPGQSGQAGQSGMSQRGGQSGQSNRQVQQHLTQDLITANRGEIQLAQMAQQQAQNDQVKQYAETIQKDHQQFIQQLQQATGGQSSAMGGGATGGAAAGGMAGGGSDAESATMNRTQRQSDAQSATRQSENLADRLDADRQDEGSDATREVYGMAAGGQGGDALRQLEQVEQQYHQRKMQAMREYFQEKEGSEFDKAYIGQQILEHQAMIAKLEAVQDHMPQQAQQVVQQGLQSTRQHLQEAEQIMRQLDQG